MTSRRTFSEFSQTYIFSAPPSIPTPLLTPLQTVKRRILARTSFAAVRLVRLRLSAPHKNRMGTNAFRQVRIRNSLGYLINSTTSMQNQTSYGTRLGVGAPFESFTAASYAGAANIIYSAAATGLRTGLSHPRSGRHIRYRRSLRSLRSRSLRISAEWHLHRPSSAVPA